jgi:hypothetical protein
LSDLRCDSQGKCLRHFADLEGPCGALGEQDLETFIACAEEEIAESEDDAVVALAKTIVSLATQLGAERRERRLPPMVAGEGT